MAGKRKGKADDRHLWPEMLRAIREIQPTWVVGENVPGLLNWKLGMVLAEIKADLEAAGFEVFPPVILPACGKNAPHRRDRLWVIAHSGSFQRSATRKVGQQCGNGRESCGEFNGISGKGVTSDTELWRCEKSRRKSVSKISHHNFQGGRLQTEPLLSRGDDGLSDWVDRIKALGNAIVPAVVFEIFKAIEMLNSDTKKI